jgi:hypothetical protein
MLAFKGPKSKLKILSSGFWLEFLDIHMNEKAITNNDCHGFKWQK